MTAGLDGGRRDLAWLAAGLLLLIGWDMAGADLTVTRWFGSATGFALRESWWTSGLLHEGGRRLAWAVLITLVVGIWRPLLAFAGLTRRERVGWVLVTLAAVLLVPAVKRVSLTSCPWDLVEFGGVAQHVSHWRWGVADGGPGHCFPSGHAAGAFAFLSGYFVLRPHRAGLARGWLAGVLLLGALFGWAQLARGAHYPSHTLWSAWGCWAVCLAGRFVMEITDPARRTAALQSADG
jgi:membrane-associated PAP2 superfamily phosphatase